MISIPVFSDPSHSETVVVDGAKLQLGFDWNTRGEYWSMSISVANIVALASVKLCLGAPLIQNYRIPSLPSGEFVVFDPSFEKSGIDKDDFADGVVYLVYLTEDEVDAL